MVTRNYIESYQLTEVNIVNIIDLISDITDVTVLVKEDEVGVTDENCDMCFQEDYDPEVLGLKFGPNDEIIKFDQWVNFHPNNTITVTNEPE